MTLGSAMKKTDRRVQRTLQSLMDALIDLVLERGYHGLTVRDIAQRADISYSTFFRHFKNIDDLTGNIMRIGRDRIVELFNGDMSAQQEAFAAFSYISRNPRIYQLFAKLPQDHPGIDIVRRELAETITAYFVTRKEHVIPLEIIAHHHATATMELFRWWIANDMKYSPDEMALIHFEMIVKPSQLVAKELHTNDCPDDMDD